MFRVVHRLEPRHVDQLVALFAREWWTLQRTVEDVRRMLDATPITIGVVDERGDLVGFARVVTDRTYCSTVLDVIVDDAYRGRGLGDLLMGTLVDHHDLQELRGGLQLKCRGEKVAFYARWGFEVTNELPPAGDQGPGAEMRRPVDSTVRPDLTARS